jgi:hypothetical protein
MTAKATTGDKSVWEILREPFPPELIDKLPKGGTTLDYVGHAAVTDRLLKADPQWNWEPLALDEHGLPAFTRNSSGQAVGLWIKLTIGGVTRLGCGTVAPGAFDAEKQLIGDALRNAAMRFGVALDLWSKSDLYFEEHAESKPDNRPAQRPSRPQETAQEPERVVRPDWMNKAAALWREAGVKAVNIPALKLAPNASQSDIQNALVAWRISVSEGQKNAGDVWVLEQFAKAIEEAKKEEAA